MAVEAEHVRSWSGEIAFERHGPIRRGFRTAVVSPMVNYLPAGLMKALLRFGKSELARANWTDPGGWLSMVISYDGRPRQYADKLLVSGGAMPTALRNRKRLGARLLAGLIDSADSEPVHVLCLGAGPGQIINEALLQASRDAHATLVDLSTDAMEYGRELAKRNGLSDRVRFVTGDVRDVHKLIDRPVDIVKMLGICEYLTDPQLLSVAEAMARVMPPGTPIVFNSLSKNHGTDRFFRRVFGLHMIHRGPQALQALMTSAGFADFVSIPEPMGVYHVIVGHRQR